MDWAVFVVIGRNAKVTARPTDGSFSPVGLWKKDETKTRSYITRKRLIVFVDEPFRIWDRSHRNRVLGPGS